MRKSLAFGLEGPLVPYAEAFAKQLREQGYAPRTVQDKLHVVAKPSHWLEEHQLPVEVLNGQRVRAFLQELQKEERRACHGDPTKLRGLLKQLSDDSVIPEPRATVNEGAQAEIVQEFSRYLTRERGLAVATVDNYVAAAVRFLTARFGEGPVELAALQAHGLTGFILVTLRRTLGFKLAGVGHDLQQFVRFAEAEGAEWVTTDLALHWAAQPAKASPAHWARRLGIVRRFSQYYSALDPRAEFPPPDFLPYHYVRKTPYLYRDEEIAALIETAAHLPSPTGLRAATYATLFGLLAVTGMRISEPIGLDRADVDLEQGSLSIRGVKFGKSRWLPLHPTATAELAHYAERRDSLYPTPSTPSFSLGAPRTGARQWSAHAQLNMNRVSDGKSGIPEQVI